ncbi:hemolysin III family protein [Psychroflexus sp. CAK57W]|uniref:PAQR family membrane homeostasis protein TrhA n=1 Tax=Psychroflexus curvus TaxID=2873595 RepID=UPI001CCA138B|nr:hemolysin III family protein [Psychroflexus curvus]MBZ9628476.1 hemolysin III family protein [Psychroflexus curvus]MBZ9788076.1 hemolysin III family protein [Psychroflexus curvus]
MKYIKTKQEEFWNTLTHGVGLLFACIGVVLLFFTAEFNDNYLTLGVILYALSLVLLYAASTSYHYVSEGRLKRRLRVLDHISIYFLIAGTYSPVVLTLLKDSHGELLFYAVWGIALLGTILKLFFTGKFEKLSLLLYLVMGWLIAFDSVAVVENFSSLELTMLALGGLFYTIGIYFYVKTTIVFNHVIWHVFVMLGSLSHFLMIYFSVART